MAITTIQLQDKIKARLKLLKTNPKETYEEVIIKLLKDIDAQKRKQRELLIEGYKEMAKDSLKICKEWDAAELE